MINDKDALLASLYSQVTFLKNEIEEKKCVYSHPYVKRK